MRIAPNIDKILKTNQELWSKHRKNQKSMKKRRKKRKNVKNSKKISIVRTEIKGMTMIGMKQMMN